MATSFTPDIEVKQLDTARTFNYTLNVGSTAVDLTNATVSLNILRPDNTTATRSATVVTPISGSVSYDLVADDTAQSGLHRLEWKVRFQDATVIRIPTNDFIYMLVNEAIGS